MLSAFRSSCHHTILLMVFSQNTRDVIMHPPSRPRPPPTHKHIHATLNWNSIIPTFTIGDFRNVFKFHAYSVNKRLLLTTAKLVRGLSDVTTTNVCKVDTSNRNHIERSRWMKWLITGLIGRRNIYWFEYITKVPYSLTWSYKPWTVVCMEVQAMHSCTNQPFNPIILLSIQCNDIDLFSLSALKCHS